VRDRDALVYVLRLGAPRPRLVLRHRLGPTGCAFGANLEWHRSLLLYSSADGRRAILDTATGRVTNLTALARALPGSLADVGLAADFRRAAPA
jgi:hypothetical protein